MNAIGRAAVLASLLLTGATVSRAQGPGMGCGQGACCRAGGQGAGCCQQAAPNPNPAQPADQPATTDTAKADPAQTPDHGMSAAEHGNIFELLSNHQSINRVVEEIPGGVKTTTTTTDPALVETLRSHVRQMRTHLEKNVPVRLWDPVFREIFAHSQEIALKYRDVDGGIEVTETSDTPQVAETIRAHAKKVDSFVADGHAAARPPWAGGGRGRGAGMGPGRGQGPGMGQGRGRGMGPGGGRGFGPPAGRTPPETP